MYDSLFEKILPLNDSLLIYPGHGAGSLCGKSIGSMKSSTLGFERKYNLSLSPREREEFVDFATSGLPEQPGNHKRIKAMNRKGPKPLGDVETRPLTIRESIPHFQRGAGLLDTRSKEEYVKAHVPGSVHLEADSQLSNRIGFVFPPDVPVILLLADPAEYEQVVYSLARVGYDNVVGYLAESLDTWQKMGLPITSGDIKDVEPVELHQIIKSCTNGDCPVVVDVREPWEYRQGHVPGAILIPLGQLSSRVNELDPERPVAVICASGNRSQSAAAFLVRKALKPSIMSPVAQAHGCTAGWNWNITRKSKETHNGKSSAPKSATTKKEQSIHSLGSIGIGSFGPGRCMADVQEHNNRQQHATRDLCGRRRREAEGRRVYFRCTRTV